MSKYIVQKPAELEDVRKAEREKLTPEFLAQNYYALVKYDGCCAVFRIDDAGWDVRSATGEIVRSCDHLAKEMFDAGMRDTYIGEVWHPEWDFPKISGAFRSHSPQPELVVKLFDCAGVYASTDDPVWCSLAFADRFRYLTAVAPLHMLAAWYTPGTYGNPYELAKQVVAQGGRDGLILANPVSTYAAGRATLGQKVKVKPTVELDLLVVGMEEGKGKYANTLGALICEDAAGKRVSVSGMSDEYRDAWWLDGEIIGEIVTVECLGRTGRGSLREPRFKAVRRDLEPGDIDTI